MTGFEEVHVGSMDPARFRAVVLGPRFDEVDLGIQDSRELFEGRAIWHVNSTARGGGVAEMLQSLLAYARGAGVDARWVVIDGDPDVLRRHQAHPQPPARRRRGTAAPLGDAERDDLRARRWRRARAELADRVRPGDVVFLHDPQTAGHGRARCARPARMVVWRCHVGVDQPNELARGAWDFLRPYVEHADAYVFSRAEFVWEGLDRDRIWIVPPSIDAFSPKNQELEPEAVARDPRDGRARPTARARRRATLRPPGRHPGPGGPRAPRSHQDAPLPAGGPLVVQVSRWDRLKDPVGVLRGLRRARSPTRDAHLLLAGPGGRPRSPTTPRAPRCSPRCSRRRERLADGRARSACTSPACRWTTSRRTRRSSTRSSGAPTSSSRRASPRASG